MYAELALSLFVLLYEALSPECPDEPEAELSAAVPETFARKPYPLPSTSTPKYLESRFMIHHDAGPSNCEVVKISCDIVKNRAGESTESPPTPKHVKVETSKRKLNLSKKHPKTETKKKVKVEKSVDDRVETLETQSDDEEDPQIEMMQARDLDIHAKTETKKKVKVEKSIDNSVETLETQSDDEEDPQIEMMQARVKILTTVMRDLEAKLKKQSQLNGNETRCNTSSASWNRPYRPQTNGSGYCRWESTRNYDVDSDGMVRIGNKHATVPFFLEVLATHSLTGKPSPAFPDKPAKKKLDAARVNDIIQTVCDNCNVEENLVRFSITTKCADESKMRRTRENNKKQRRLSKKENDPHQDSSSGESFSE
ncbi:BEN domain-containing protein [Phthorimaea operculella]|nr:BEN domain-containing protein [Phthorimaea operculella]